MNLVFFLEGQSEKTMLEILMPKVLDNNTIETKYIVFEGKYDLIEQLPTKLKGWYTPAPFTTKFIILLDQDKDECIELKKQISDICQKNNQSKNSLIRIACQELESWYFGDLNAVENGLEINNFTKKNSNKSQYRIPDNIEKPSKQLERITNNKYQKIEGSRAIAEHLSIKNNTSTSYQIFISGIQKIVKQG